MAYIPNPGSVPLKKAAPMYHLHLPFEQRPEKRKPNVSDRPLARPTTQQTARDQIESRYTCPQIRQLYALHLAGKGIRTKLEDIDQRHLKAAFKEPDIEKIVDTLALHWDAFKK